MERDSNKTHSSLSRTPRHWWLAPYLHYSSVSINSFHRLTLDGFAWCIRATDISKLARSIVSLIHLSCDILCGGTHLCASILLAAVRASSSQRWYMIGRSRSERSFSNITVGEGGILCPVMFDIVSAILYQNCLTGGHSHIVWMKVPVTWREHNWQSGEASTFIRKRLCGK